MKNKYAKILLNSAFAITKAGWVLFQDPFKAVPGLKPNIVMTLKSTMAATFMHGFELECWV
jgi:hypothetical protein